MIRLRKISANLLFFSIVFFASQRLNAQMEFIENKGQWHNNVKYRGDFKTGSFFLESKGFTVMLHDTNDVKNLSESMHGHTPDKSVQMPESFTLHSFAYKVNFLGASTKVQTLPDKPIPTHNNYFLGNDKSSWAGDCKLYQAVTYKDVYPNIDLRYYSNGNDLKYDLIVHPGGNPNMIAMQYEGPKEIFVKDRELNIETPVGLVKELYPYSYQPGAVEREEIECRYVVRNNVVTLQLKKYDPTKTLIIDPAIIFCSFVGNSTNTDIWSYTATPGPDGSLFAGGITFSAAYPVSAGAYSTTFNSGPFEDNFPGYDIGIFKFNSTGSARVYATFLGGTGNEQPHSMITDAQGNLIIAGRTNSSNYPVTGPRLGPGGAYDIIISKLSANGGSLLGSIELGGSNDDGVNIKPKYRGTPGSESIRRNYGDDARSEVILDGAGNIILSSCTQSSNFPVSGSGIQAGFGGAQDGLILKFNSNLSAMLFGSFFGGSGDDACFVTSINPITGNIYVGGSTTSNNLQGDKTSVIGPAFFGGVSDGFVTEVTPNGSGIIKTTYLGTPGIDMLYGLKFDKLGFPYVTGTTTGNWPVISAPFSNPGSKQFISKLKPDLSAYVYSTVFGTNSAFPNISPTAFMVDRCQNVYVSGWGGGVNNKQGYNSGTTNGLPEVDPLPNIPGPDGQDFYFFVLQKNAQSQLFGSHFGQFGGFGDHVDGGTSRFDENGIIYQAICANCGGGVKFPTSSGVWVSSNPSTNCNEIALKIEMNFTGVGAGLQASINSVTNDTIGCVPLKVDFKDTLQKGKTYYWNFGDGSPVLVTTVPQVSHVFNTIGVYHVMLISEDSLTCNIRDTGYKTIRVGDMKANLNFLSQKLPPCESLTMQYTNTSTLNRGAFGPKSFYWDYGDGSPRDTAGFTPPRIHTYAAAGIYKVKLFLQDTAFCNSPDSIEKVVRISPLVKAMFITPDTGCAPYLASFENTSLAGTDFLWEFGDNTTSTEVSPTHLYANPGTYRVRLIATDTSTCNKRDTSAYQTITVVPKPVASFDWGPNPPVANVPVTFTNLSSADATHYIWNFGDGETSTVVNPVHEYNESGTFTAELISFNRANCSDTFRRAVTVIVNPLLDVPNAFTPGQFGVNGYVMVRGFGIGKMDWRIYNRWGQMIFRTESRKIGWDGTFKGKLQPMDVYTYTLDVEFTDGRKVRKTGDITLLR